MSTLPQTTAGKLDMITELLSPMPIIDDKGNIIGYGPPLLTVEEVRKIINA